MRKWSVLRWPVALAAMSERTTSAGPPSQSFRICGASGSRKSRSRNSTPGTGAIGQKIDAEDFAFALGCACLGGGDLRPAARRGAEIDDLLAAFQDVIARVDLDELVGGARTIALALSPARHKDR